MKKQRGFTIIELMISTTIFSLILMICLAGILQITKMYYTGITQARTREAARTVVDEIAEAIRFTNQQIQLDADMPEEVLYEINEDSTSYFCVGSKRYVFAIDRQTKTQPRGDSKQKRHALWVDQEEGCIPPGPNFLDAETPTNDGRDLLAENMRLFELRITERVAGTNIYDVSVGVAYGDDDLLFPRPAEDPTELTCEGGFVGAEFCATTNFLVTVEKRL